MLDDKTLAAQLRCPHGEIGIEVGLSMNERNRDMNEMAIEALKPDKGDKILEIGPGNGAFVQQIFDIQPNILYYAIDISEDMIAAASQTNAAFIKAGKAKWYLGSSDKLPFDDHYIDKIMTVNTLYFMKPLENYLHEIYRVLKPGGTFINSFGSKDFMQKMEFTKHGFTLYSKESAIEKFNAAGFKVRKIHVIKSEIVGIEDVPIEKEAYCMKIEKPMV